MLPVENILKHYIKNKTENLHKINFSPILKRSSSVVFIEVINREVNTGKIFCV